MQNIKGIVDDLTLIGHPLSDSEIVAHTLNGLGNDYKELCTAIRTRETAMTFEELHDKLLDHETFINREEGRKVEPSVTAQLTQRSHNYKGRGGTGRLLNNNYFNKQFQMTNQGYL